MNKSSIGSRIREARVRAGLNQVELAALLKAGRVTISQWETGAKKVGPRSLSALARALSVEELWLTVGQGPMVLDRAAETGAPYQAEAPLDLQALTFAIERLEAFLTQHRKKLAPADKAQALAQLYATMRLWRPEALVAANVTPLLQGLLAG